MSLDLTAADAPPVSSPDELVAYFRQAERPRALHRVGLEHEKHIYPAGGSTPVPYEGPAGIEALLQALAAHGYQPFREADGLPVIALTRGVETISLEPGGQLELSGSPFPTAREAHRENLRHLEEVKGACAGLGLRAVALGYRPFGTVAAMPWMPKRRYQVMRETLGGRGRLALDMMLMTATGQVSLDWVDEADCARKVSVSARLTPLLVALFANSPLANGRPTGLMSYRSRVWTEVDPARCGFLPSMLDGSFSYRAYVEWALDAPLLFLRREGRYLRPKLTFRQLLARGYEGAPALHTDWVDHLSTMFPEVRIKRVIEIRGADSCSAEMTGGLVALMRGLLYDPGALEAAERLLPPLGFSEHLALHALAQERGLEGELRGRRLSELALELVAIARDGLRRLDPDDVPLLEPLAEVARAGRSPARAALERFERDGADALFASAEL